MSTQLNLDDPQIRETITKTLNNWRQNHPAMIDDILVGLEKVADKQERAKKRKAKNGKD